MLGLIRNTNSFRGRGVVAVVLGNCLKYLKDVVRGAKTCWMATRLRFGLEIGNRLASELIGLRDMRIANVKLLKIRSKRLHTTRALPSRLTILRLVHGDVTKRNKTGVICGLITLVSTGKARVVEDVELGRRIRNVSHRGRSVLYPLFRTARIRLTGTRSGGTMLTMDECGLEVQKTQGLARYGNLRIQHGGGNDQCSIKHHAGPC